MDRDFEKVREFQRVFGLPIGEKPRPLTPDRIEVRAEWLREEVGEFEEAADIYGQADAMIDLIYFALGTLVEMGVKPGEIFDVVHEANMAKRWSDGKAHRRESDGKILKPPDWEDPEPKIKAAIDKIGREVR